jgi:hypothetical protein
MKVRITTTVTTTKNSDSKMKSFKKNTIDIPSSKFCLKTQIKAKVRLLSTLNYWNSRFPLFIEQLKGLGSKKNWRAKLVAEKNVPFHRLP